MVILATMIIVSIMYFYLGSKNEKHATTMWIGVIFAIIILLSIKDSDLISFQITLGYIIGVVVAFFLSVILGIGLLVGTVGEAVVESAERAMKNKETKPKNEVSNINDNKEYNVKVIETEELKVETVVDEENLVVEENIEYEKNRLVIVEEKKRSLVDRIFNRK